MIAEVWRFTFHDKRPLLQGKFSAMPINAIYCSVLLLNRRACTLSLCLIFGFSAICREANAQLLSIYAEDFVKATFQSPETVWEPAISAGGSVAWNDFVSPIEGFSSGWKGYGHHYAVALADNVNGKFMRDFVLAAASHQEDMNPCMSVLQRTRNNVPDIADGVSSRAGTGSLEGGGPGSLRRRLICI